MDRELRKERKDLIARFVEQLERATEDGSRKRRASLKPPWYIDDSHEAAMFRHLARWKSDPDGRDPDSWAHHLVAVAWRALAIACKETGNVPRREKWADLPEKDADALNKAIEEARREK